MKKHGKVLAGLLAVFVIVFGMGAFFVNNVSFKQDKEIEQKKVVTENAGADTTAEINELINKSSAAKFTVLEIVPDMAAGELGYMIAGQEPQDWEALCMQGKAEAIVNALDLDTDKEKNWRITQEEYDAYKAKYGSETWWESAWKEIPGDEEGEESEYKCAYPKYENYGSDDKLGELVDAIDNGSSKVAVLTVTAAQLNGGDTATDTLLEQTDMVYIHQNAEYSFSADDNKLDLKWSVAKKIFKEAAVREDSNGNYDPMVIFFDKSVYTDAIANGKSVSPTQYILDRAEKKLKNTSEGTATSNGSDNNVCKLYIMSMFRDSAEFYHLFLSEDSKKANGESVCENGNFSKQSGDAKEYWNSYTFLPTEEIINKDPSDATKVTYEYKKANEEYWKKLRISYDGSATSNGSAYAFDFSSKTLLKQWETAMSDLKKALAYEPKMRVTKKEYTVLDIEPAAYKDTTKKSKIEELLKEKIIRLCPYQEYTNVKKEEITIHLNSMTTAEFIGRQEDIVAKYDFVYIGSCTDNLWMEASQDTSMKNVIYAHVGAMVGATAPKWDPYVLYPKSSDRTYFPGNDITNLKRKALKSFLDTGYPMVIASDLLKDGKADESKFDDTTNNNMYAFINDAIDSKQVLQEDFDYRTYSAEEANKILQSLDMKKPKLEITSYINGKDKNAKISNDGSLSISFKVTDSYDTDSKRTYYIAKMYIDKNADGLYDEKSELFAKSGTFRGNGDTVTLKKGLNTTYSGALTWKLEVVKMQNGAETAIKECEVGYNTIEGGAAELVNVLQIMGDGATDGSTDWAKKNAETLNLTTDLKGFIDDSVVKADYDLRVKAIHMKEFDDYIEILDNYDILIFGFADSYIDKNLSGAAAEKVQQYIDDGHSVLFTHDLTSQQNNEKFYTAADGFDPDPKKTGVERFTGFYFTQYFRETMGMNRFGIASQEVTYDKKKDGLISSINSRIESGVHDKTSKTSETSETSKTKYGYTYGALMQYGLMPGIVSTSGKTYQGPYNDLYLNTYSHSDKDKENFQNVDGTGYVTRFVENVNDGQITKYPFDLSGETPQIAETHSQYYQLNMEDPDIVVWYTLSGGDKLADGTAVPNGNDGSWYTKSPRDVSNNYYIYNKGNVTYSGVGHRDGMTEFEKKLFVNTIIASLRAGVEGPQVQVTNATYNDADECYYMQADIDEDATADQYGGHEEIKFRVTDDSAKAGDRMYIRLNDLVPKPEGDTSTPAPTATAAPDNSVIVYYNNTAYSANPTMHYQIGSGAWADITMEPTSEKSGYRWKCEVKLGAETKLTATFNENGGKWDNNGTLNYNLEPGTYCISGKGVIKIANGNTGAVGADPTQSSKYKEDAVKTGVYKITGPNVGTTTIGGETYIVVNRASSTGIDDNVYTISYPRTNFKGTDEDHKIVTRALRITALNSQKAKAHADVVISRRSMFNLD